MDTIVLVDDEADVLDFHAEALQQLPARLLKFGDPLAAWEKLQQERVALVVTDWNMPKMTGMDLLFKTRGLSRPPYVILLTAFGTVERAVQAMNAGAFTFLQKPVDLQAFRNAVREALDHVHTHDASACRAPAAEPKPGQPIGRSPAMQRVYDMAFSAAKTESSVLLLGETGTGKEVLADFIHANSRRAAGPIVKVNCGSLPEQLMESELFGHEKGAFTGADRRTTGRFEQAAHGTLFLDEIGDLLPHLQVKLLRALQNRVIERVGSGAPVPVDFRLICATHRDLKGAVAGGAFREDLYYRVNVVPILLPALRERADDIVPLAQHFLQELQGQKGAREFSVEALASLKQFSWPGNVRQLRNAVEFALVMCKGNVITPSDLPSELREPSALLPAPAAAQPPLEPVSATADEGLKHTVQAAEAEVIRAALEKNRWQMAKTARELKISRSTLYARLETYGIKKPT